MGDFQRLGGHVLIALDGSEYHCSKTIRCDACQRRKRNDGQLEYYHSMLSATIVAPGHNKVLPLEPEFITPQDGHDKQDCENAAIKRWLAAHAGQYQHLKPIYLGDDLMSRQPICESVQDVGANFMSKPQKLVMASFRRRLCWRCLLQAQLHPRQRTLRL